MPHGNIKLSLEERVWKHIYTEPNTGCWLWGGYVSKDGYGSFQMPFGKKEQVAKSVGGAKKAHRVVYEMYKGPIPDGLTIDHLCRVKCCVNPLHLEAVTLEENCARSPGTFKGKYGNAKVCVRGHEFTPENTLLLKQPRNKGRNRRICRECARVRLRAFKHRRRGELN